MEWNVGTHMVRQSNIGNLITAKAARLASICNRKPQFPDCGWNKHWANFIGEIFLLKKTSTSRGCAILMKRGRLDPEYKIVTRSNRKVGLLDGISYLSGHKQDGEVTSDKRDKLNSLHIFNKCCPADFNL